MKSEQIKKKKKNFDPQYLEKDRGQRLFLSLVVEHSGYFL